MTVRGRRVPAIGDPPVIRWGVVNDIHLGWYLVGPDVHVWGPAIQATDEQIRSELVTDGRNARVLELLGGRTDLVRIERASEGAE